MKKTLLTLTGAAALMVSTVCIQAENPFVGKWALTTPNGGAGWLEIKEMPGYLDGSILWESGSVIPLDSVVVQSNEDGKSILLVTRIHEEKRKDASGKVIRVQRYTESIGAQRQGDMLFLFRSDPNRNGEGFTMGEFTGKLMPTPPAAPDLSKVEFGPAVELFNGKNLDGWRLTDEKAVNGWFAKDGLLVCDPKQEEGKPHKNYGNLRTDAEFEDFNLTLQVKVEKGGNSGIYLRGVCEVQVADTYGKGLDSHNMGGLYSRITPSESAERPAGEWQDYDVTYCDQHVTVILNGKKIIDNELVEGCTGGALWSDISRPGPIYLQGDHTGVEYKNIKLRPILKK